MLLLCLKGSRTGARFCQSAARTAGFPRRSRYNLVPMSEGAWRLVLNLEALRMGIAAVQPGRAPRFLRILPAGISFGQPASVIGRRRAAWPAAVLVSIHARCVCDRRGISPFAAF